MAAAAEAAFKQLVVSAVAGSGLSPPVYVIGTDVPPPGGIQAEEGAVPVTRVEDFRETIATCEQAFHDVDLGEAWNRVVAVVVQPGVEFGDHTIHEYDRSKARELIAAARQFPSLILEGHSTDYQPPDLLRQLIEDGIAILKVGPALTFAMRECLFALEMIERELLGSSYKIRISQLGAFLDKAMMDNPEHWQNYYTGTDIQKRLACRYSLLDRSRYYWSVPMVQEAVNHLLANLQKQQIPLSLLSQYLPRHYQKIRSSSLNPDPESLIRESVRMVLREYSAAIR